MEYCKLLLSSVYNFFRHVINPFNSKAGFITSYLSNDDYHLCQRLSHIHQSVDFLDRTSFLQKINWIIHRDVNWSRHQYGIQRKEVTISHTFSHDVNFHWSKAVFDLWTSNQLYKIFQSNNIRSISISSQKHILLLVSKLPKMHQRVLPWYYDKYEMFWLIKQDQRLTVIALHIGLVI